MNVKNAQRQYLEGLRKYKELGVKVKIDGMELPENEWKKIFRVAERTADGNSYFYMADFITASEGKISEIRLDKVYVKTGFRRR